MRSSRLPSTVASIAGCVARMSLDRARLLRGQGACGRPTCPRRHGWPCGAGRDPVRCRAAHGRLADTAAAIAAAAMAIRPRRVSARHANKRRRCRGRSALPILYGAQGPSRARAAATRTSDEDPRRSRAAVRRYARSRTPRRIDRVPCALRRGDLRRRSADQRGIESAIARPVRDVCARAGAARRGAAGEAKRIHDSCSSGKRYSSAAANGVLEARVPRRLTKPARVSSRASGAGPPRSPDCTPCRPDRDAALVTPARRRSRRPRILSCAVRQSCDAPLA
jgi:hypothetical protein